MTLPDALARRLRPHLPGPPEAFEPVGGGCIAQGGRLTAGGQSFFLKRGATDVARAFPGEAAGLRALRAAAASAEGALHVPDVHAVEAPAGDAPGFLLMEWIEPGAPLDASFWKTFGRGLAALHRPAADGGDVDAGGKRYGFAEDNFIGRLPQENEWTATWPAFFRERRLDPQVRRARESGRWYDAWDAPFEALCARLPELLPETPPASVLHGDLWSGNFLARSGSGAALIDPAVYHGHRETDLALTELFGGFPSSFYDAYRSAWPLAAGYDTRRDVYNLYHLVNHLNHFGESYAGQVERTLRSLA